MFNKIIDSEYFSNNFDVSKFLSKDTVPAITDTFKYSNGSFYYQDGRVIKHFLNNNKVANLKATVISGNNELLEIEANKSVFLKDYFENGILKRKFDEVAWRQYVQDNFVTALDTEFTDHVTEYQTLPKSENVNVSSDSVYSYKFSFNFNSINYENAINSLAFQEYLLPDVFTLVSNKNAQIDTERENLLLSYGGLVPESYHESLLIHEKLNDNIREYFIKYAEAVNSQDGITVRNQIQRTTPNYKVISKKNMEQTNGLNNNFIPFPFHVQFNFTNQTDNQLAQKLTINGLSREIIDDIQQNIQFASIQQVTLPIYFTKNFMVNNNEVAVKVFDLKNWIRNAALQTVIPAETDAITNSHARTLSIFDTVEYIKKYVNVNKRTFSEVLEGKNCKTYNLFYKITKKALTDKNTVLQTFYVLNNANEIVKFFDTQVKYGKKYVYEVAMCSLIVGNSYAYSEVYENEDVKNNDIVNGKYRVRVMNDTSHKIAELPLFKFEGTILQNPVSTPNIELSSFDGNNTDLKIKFANLSIDHTNEFEVLEPSDIQLFNGIKESNIRVDNTKCESKNLQIYKSTKKPKLYSDFFGSLVKTITVDNETLIIDSIEPNITYFYTFRVVNEHNIPSNPTAVYKIKLVDEDGLVYLQKELLSLERQINKQPYKNMKRYVFVRPSINQRVISNDLEELLKDYQNGQTSDIVQLGVSRIKVWNRLFKLKIRSKESGKVMNMYFRFKYKGD